MVGGRHLVCGNCASWILQHENSGCEKKWADTRVEGFVFTCKGCTGVAAMAKEVDGLKQMVEDMKEMVAGLRFVDKGADTGSRVTTTGVNQDREEAAGKNRTEEMVTGIDDEGEIRTEEMITGVDDEGPSQPTAAGRRRRISGYERRWAAILPAITRQRAAAVKTDHVICHLKRCNCLQRAFSGPLMSKWSVSGVFLNILKTFRNNHDRKN